MSERANGKEYSMNLRPSDVRIEDRHSMKEGLNRASTKAGESTRSGAGSGGMEAEGEGQDGTKVSTDGVGLGWGAFEGWGYSRRGQEEYRGG